MTGKVTRAAGNEGLDAVSPAIPSSSPYWNVGINSGNFPSQAPMAYTGNTLDDGSVLAGNAIHQALDEYNNFGTVNGVMYGMDGDTLI